MNTDGGDGPQLTEAEWAALERYHRRGYNNTWNRDDKVVLTTALTKAYGQPGALRPVDLAKIRKWIEGSEAQE